MAALLTLQSPTFLQLAYNLREIIIMKDNIVTTHAPVTWIDIEDFPPTSGSRLQCLTIGGVQVSAVITADNIKHFVAYMPHVRVSEKIKTKLVNLYTKV